MNEALFSSKSVEWSTPQDFFDALDAEFHFTLDPCADDENHKCDLYFTKEQDGLKQDWGGHTVFCNPPYCRQTGKWVQKAVEECKKPGTTVVLLIPARPDVSYFHDYLYKKTNVELRFVRGRLKFGGSKQSAPFPPLVAVIRG